ncbi:hypothetical protein LTR86_008757 [Recurvomyces mirabilis]|nr:hypothetical protein LTR86_008757 [Recurvomyces mirabilis]
MKRLGNMPFKMHFDLRHGKQDDDNGAHDSHAARGHEQPSSATPSMVVVHCPWRRGLPCRRLVLVCKGRQLFEDTRLGRTPPPAKTSLATARGQSTGKGSSGARRQEDRTHCRRLANSTGIVMAWNVKR